MTHETKNGQIIMIAKMEDSHLKNTVKLHIKTIKDAKELLSGSTEIKIQQALYDQASLNIEKKLLQSISKSRESLPVYLMECMIRGIDFKEELRDIFDRNPNKISVHEIALNLFQKEIQKNPNILQIDEIEYEHKDAIHDIEDFPF